MNNPEEENQLARQLAQGISEMGLAVSGQQQALLLEYLALLNKWNKAYNLTAIRQPEKMVVLHLLDSLSILPFVKAGRVLDVGTGGGLPGIPLAICLPETAFILLDSNGKKTRFLFHVVNTLGLDNVEVVNDRAENFQSSQQIDIVLTRAFASLKQTLEWTGHLLSPSGSLLAMKGTYPAEEIAEIPDSFRVVESSALEVPGNPGQRQLVEIRRVLSGQEQSKQA
jgi:16S rRNA (guanine527-N7)-methyltransferase